MHRISTILLFIFGIYNIPNAQVIASYTFDDCAFGDALGTFPAATTIFPPSCDCGPVANGLYFDGNDDGLIFPDTLVDILEEDFTIDFYFQLDVATNRTDILSIRSECSLDSFISITYSPFDESLSFSISPRIASLQTEKVVVNTSTCWHRLTLTKSGLVYNLYLDDQLSISMLSDGIVQFSPNAKLTLSNSPCLAVNEDRFNGWIDEFKIYNRALSNTELVSISLQPDQILNNDTTIVAGSPVPISVGVTCASNFTWTPSTDLDDSSILDPVASPSTTTTYILTTTNTNGCTSRDEMTINVIDPDRLDCNQLLLPNAFTPNGDQLNDRYGISNLFLVDDIVYFEIYDRWGAKMWLANGKNDTWDGSFKGQVVNAGMYIYKVKYTCGGSEYVKVDNFSVLR